MSIHVKSVVYSSSTGPMKRLFEETKHYPEDGINVFQRPEQNYPIQGCARGQNLVCGLVQQGLCGSSDQFANKLGYGLHGTRLTH
jgi:hypothetical protein